MHSTYERLRARLVKEYNLDPRQVTPNTALEALGIDSLGLADLLSNVEDQFLIILPTEQVDLLTFGDVVKFVDGLIAAQSGTIVHAHAATREELQAA